MAVGSGPWRGSGTLARAEGTARSKAGARRVRGTADRRRSRRPIGRDRDGVSVARGGRAPAVPRAPRAARGTGARSVRDRPAHCGPVRRIGSSRWGWIRAGARARGERDGAWREESTGPRQGSSSIAALCARGSPTRPGGADPRSPSLRKRGPPGSRRPRSPATIRRVDPLLPSEPRLRALFTRDRAIKDKLDWRPGYRTPIEGLYSTWRVYPSGSRDRRRDGQREGCGATDPARP